MANSERKALFSRIVNDWLGNNADFATNLSSLRARLEAAGLLVYVDNSDQALDALSNGAVFVRVGAEEGDTARNLALGEYLKNIHAASSLDGLPPHDDKYDQPSSVKRLIVYADGRVETEGEIGSSDALYMLRCARENVKHFMRARTLPAEVHYTDDIPF